MLRLVTIAWTPAVLALAQRYIRARRHPYRIAIALLATPMHEQGTRRCDLDMPNVAVSRHLARHRALWLSQEPAQ